MDNSFLQAIGSLAPEEPREPHDAPIILHQGQYRLYEKPDGTLRIQYRRDGAEQDEYAELPAVMIRLAKAMSDGSMSPMQLMAEASKLMMSLR